MKGKNILSKILTAVVAVSMVLSLFTVPASAAVIAPADADFTSTFENGTDFSAAYPWDGSGNPTVTPGVSWYCVDKSNDDVKVVEDGENHALEIGTDSSRKLEFLLPKDGFSIGWYKYEFKIKYVSDSIEGDITVPIDPALYGRLASSEDTYRDNWALNAGGFDAGLETTEDGNQHCVQANAARNLTVTNEWQTVTGEQFWARLGTNAGYNADNFTAMVFKLTKGSSPAGAKILIDDIKIDAPDPMQVTNVNLGTGNSASAMPASGELVIDFGNNDVFTGIYLDETAVDNYAAELNTPSVKVNWNNPGPDNLGSNLTTGYKSTITDSNIYIADASDVNTPVGTTAVSIVDWDTVKLTYSGLTEGGNYKLVVKNVAGVANGLAQPVKADGSQGNNWQFAIGLLNSMGLKKTMKAPYEMAFTVAAASEPDPEPADPGVTELTDSKVTFAGEGYTAIIAQFNGTKLVTATSVVVTEDGQEATYTKNGSTTAVKVFMWNSLTGMNPVADVYPAQ